jgi:hypothetical protein
MVFETEDRAVDRKQYLVNALQEKLLPVSVTRHAIIS